MMQQVERGSHRVQLRPPQFAKAYIVKLWAYTMLLQPGWLAGCSSVTQAPCIWPIMCKYNIIHKYITYRNANRGGQSHGHR